MLISGGRIAAWTLRELGGDTIFSVSGNQVLPIFDSAGDCGLRIVHMRHESAVAYAAVGYAEMRDCPGVLLVSAGPASLAALTGVATAKALELPLLFLAGASPSNDVGVGHFQEFDTRSAVAPACKAVLEASSS